MYSTLCTGAEDQFVLTRGSSYGGCVIVNINLKNLWISCPWCEGTRTMFETPAQPCKACRGQGGTLKNGSNAVVELVKHVTRGHR
jgi:hypothetical protein